MSRTKIIIPGLVIAGLVSTLVFLASCTGTTTTGTTGTSTGSSTSSFLILIGFIVVLFGLMYFLTIRPQRKRQQEQMKLIQGIQKGDKVVTIGGMYGNVESVSEDSVVIRTEGGSTVRFVKSAIANKITDQTPQVK